MRKIKKFRILESGRIYNNEELNEIKGGDSCGPNYVTCMSGYATCNTLGYRTCDTTSLAGYTTDGSNTYCEAGHTYNQCTEGLPVYDTCSAEHTYSTYPL